MRKHAQALSLSLYLISGLAFAGNERLLQGYFLQNGSYINSPNGRYALTMQTDGSLVMYRSDGSIRYSMEKYGTYAIMQTDGNFVEYQGGNGSTGGGTAIWSTNSGTCVDCWLEIYNDGGLSIVWHNADWSQARGTWGIGADTDIPARWDAQRFPIAKVLQDSSASSPTDQFIPASLVISY